MKDSEKGQDSEKVEEEHRSGLRTLRYLQFGASYRQSPSTFPTVIKNCDVTFHVEQWFETEFR